MTPRLLLLVNAFADDAPTRLMLETARAARLSGRFQCCLAALSRGGPLEAEARAAAGEACHLASSPFGALRAPVRLLGLIRRWQPDIVHTALLRPTIMGIHAARRAGVAHVVATCHGVHEWSEARPFPPGLIRRLYIAAAKRSDFVVGVSDAVRRDLISAGLDGERVRTVPNGVDAQRFSPLPAASPVDKPRSLRIGSAGNLRPIKGFDILVDALRLLSRQSPAALFEATIWGDGSERAALEQRIRESGISSIRLAGRCPDMPAALRACDIYVQPSRSESFGLAAAEAMASGIPAVVSSAGGLPELVGSGDDAGGLVFECGSATELSESLSRLMEDEDLRIRLGHNARRRVLDKFTRERMTESTMSLYDELLARSPAP